MNKAKIYKKLIMKKLIIPDLDLVNKSVKKSNEESKINIILYNRFFFESNRVHVKGKIERIQAANQFG
jgi:hypothetical protein